jgi:hypothetical protein
MKIRTIVGEDVANRVMARSDFNLLAIRRAHSGRCCPTIVNELCFYGLRKNLAIKMAESAVLNG